MPRFVISGLGRPRKLRATDADRDAYGELVNKAFSEGQLDSTMFEFRSSKVLNAKTVGELDDLVADLTTPETGVTVDPPATRTAAAVTSKAVKAGLFAIVGFAVLLALIIGVAVSFGTESSSIQPSFPGVDVSVPPLEWNPEPSVDMYSPDGLQQVVDDLVAAAGSPDFTWLGVYGEYALASGPGRPGATRVADYDWRNGTVSKDPGSETLDEDELFDVTTDIDIPAIGTLASTAATKTGVVDPTSVYISVDRNLTSADHEVEVRVTLSNDYQDGYVTADHLGEIISIEGPGIEADASRFFKAANASKALVAIRTRLGHDEVTEVRFYGEYVAAEAPPEPGAEVIDGYEYRGGSTAVKEPYTPFQPDDVRASVFSLADIDGAVVAQAITDAVTAADLPGAEVSLAYVQRPRRPVGHDPVIVVVLYTDYESAEVIYSLTGELLQVS